MGLESFILRSCWVGTKISIPVCWVRTTVLIKDKPLAQGKSKPWRFEAAWLQSSQCEQVVDRGWRASWGAGPSVCISTQLEQCRLKLCPVLCPDQKALYIELKKDKPLAQGKSKPWRFEAAWLQSSQCEQVVDRGWRASWGAGPSVCISTQLEQCRLKLRL
ncbi:hypothetical protein Salat_0184500 [Sesamum alatum]|uniref:Uncharacterized protein n=1 Tax=Sesamum alatum TaxID=300844 RepID=A0AAE1YYM4_9LAMI|nr:hypothetical protein Salat_0184500 [Sesamum alatum]